MLSRRGWLIELCWKQVTILVIKWIFMAVLKQHIDCHQYD